MQIEKDKTMLLDVHYVRATKNNPTDYIYLVCKDLDTGEKFISTIPEPDIDIYFEKPEYRDHMYNKNYAKMDTLFKQTVKAKNVAFAIAKEMGDAGNRHIKNCYANRDFNGLKELLIYPYVYGADYDTRVYYRYNFVKNYDTKRAKVLTKGFLDIEVDMAESSTGKPDANSDPIDLVTFMDITHNKSYTFCLINRPYMGHDPEKEKLYKKRHDTENYYVEHIDELMDEIHKKFDEKYPSMEYKVYFYKDEKLMLIHLFQLINKLKLDFVGVWNISFDIPYIMGRLEYFKLNPADVMCHPDFPVKQCYFKKDNFNFAIKNKADFFFCSSYTVFFDQMIVYAAIRKGQSELRSNKLTYIAQKEINDEKLDYSEEGNLISLGYNNWLKYFLYNIKDVLLQKGIEERTGDVDTYYATSYENITPYDSEFKAIAKLRNTQYLYYLNSGMVPGENVNGFVYNHAEKSDLDEDEEEDETGFEGALVGNPKLIEKFGQRMFGKRTNNIFKFNIDFDMGAFYPSTIFAMNIDPSTLLFKVIIDAGQFDVRGGDLPFNGYTDEQIVKENKDSFVGDIAKEIFDNYQTRDYVSTAHKWMNLPSINDVYERIKAKTLFNMEHVA